MVTNRLSKPPPGLALDASQIGLGPAKCNVRTMNPTPVSGPMGRLDLGVWGSEAELPGRDHAGCQRSARGLGDPPDVS